MDWFSPPKMAAAVLALAIATVVTWVITPHRVLPVRAEPYPIAAAFAEVDRATVSVPIKVIPIKKGEASSVIPKTSSVAPKADKELFDKSDQQPEEREPPVRRDMCARYGGHRVEFRRHHREVWRCSYPHRHRHHHRRRD